ncbi:hypothetical protein CYL18_16445 [Pradoshia eiseniae]|uniref:Uncharacterized protein n=1 Tax=Pradoshia eiseniae TaxID=2064768 RepID=A0A2S7MW68_9BACI|nr:hypothetical protein CYL18_16445 [Pradoshia eiseniae]
MGKGRPKGGKSQAIPTLYPGKGGEGWSKGGRKVGKARQSPPLSQATGVKGGQRAVEGWEKPGKAHLYPRQRG